MENIDYDELWNALPPGARAPFSVLWSLLLLLLMVRVSEKYITHTMSRVGTTFKMDSDMVGLLFLNIGNSAPDLVSSIVAYKIDPSILIDSTLGSYLFIITVVAGTSIIFKRGNERLSYNTFYKNVFFLLIAVIHILHIYIASAITVSMTVSLLFFYAIFLSYSFSSSSHEAVEIVESAPSDRGRWKKYADGALLPLSVVLDSSVLLNTSGTNRALFDCMHLLSPACNLLLFSFLLAGTTDLGAAPYACALALGVYFFRIRKRSPSSILAMLYTFAVSILWISVLSSEFIRFPTFLFEKLGVARALVSFTVIAWGNSLGDLVTGVSASRKGMFKLAMSASFTAPIQNVLFNLGIISLVRHLRHPAPGTFELTHLIPKYAIFFSAVTFFLFLINFELRKRRFDREVGLFLYCIYAIVLGCCIYDPLRLPS